MRKIVEEEEGVMCPQRPAECAQKDEQEEMVCCMSKGMPVPTSQPQSCMQRHSSSREDVCCTSALQCGMLDRSPERCRQL